MGDVVKYRHIAHAMEGIDWMYVTYSKMAASLSESSGSLGG